MTTPSPQYIPGVCNIGAAEIKQRKRIGRIGFAVTLVVWFAFLYLHVASVWDLILFFPAAISATGFLQGSMHFCAGFGMKGAFNFGTELYKTESVSQQEFRTKDKKKAQQIFTYSILIGFAVAIIAYFVR